VLMRPHKVVKTHQYVMQASRHFYEPEKKKESKIQ
jgi:hypothetical protein